MSTTTKSNKKRVGLHSQVTIHCQGKLEAGNETETMEEGSSPLVSFAGGQPAVLYSPRPPPQDGTAQSGLCPLTSISNAPTDTPTSQPDGILQLVLLPRSINLTTKLANALALLKFTA